VKIFAAKPKYLDFEFCSSLNRSIFRIVERDILQCFSNNRSPEKSFANDEKYKKTKKTQKKIQNSISMEDLKSLV